MQSNESDSLTFVWGSGRGYYNPDSMEQYTAFMNAFMERECPYPFSLTLKLIRGNETIQTPMDRISWEDHWVEDLHIWNMWNDQYLFTIYEILAEQSGLLDCSGRLIFLGGKTR